MGRLGVAGADAVLGGRPERWAWTSGAPWRVPLNVCGPFSGVTPRSAPGVGVFVEISPAVLFDLVVALPLVKVACLPEVVDVLGLDLGPVFGCEYFVAVLPGWDVGDCRAGSVPARRAS